MRGRGEVGMTPDPTCFAGHLLPQGEKGAQRERFHCAPSNGSEIRIGASGGHALSGPGRRAEGALEAGRAAAISTSTGVSLAGGKAVTPMILGSAGRAALAASTAAAIWPE